MSLQKGKITMVIPLYNKVDYIRDTLEFVLKHHGNTPFECIIVDDNSTDGSSDIAMSFEKIYPEVFTYVKIQHRGKYNPSYARNIGIRLCESEYITFLDADDILLEGGIDRCVNYLNEHSEIDVYGESFTRTNLFVSSYDLFLDKLDNFLYYEGNQNFVGFTPSICATVFRSEIVKSNPFIDYLCEDMIFMYTILYKSKGFLFDLRYHHYIYVAENSDVNNKVYQEYNLDTNNEYDFFKEYINKLNELNPGFPYCIKINEFGQEYLSLK